MLNYSKGKPVGNNGIPQFDSPPAVKAIATYTDENALVSSVITLTQNTTAIEVGAVGGAAVLRWIGTGDTEGSVISAVSGANYDHSVGTGTVRRFVVPVEGVQATGYGSLMGTNREEGLFRRVALKTVGIASVMLTEYGSSNSY